MDPVDVELVEHGMSRAGVLVAAAVQVMAGRLFEPARVEWSVGPGPDGCECAVTFVLVERPVVAEGSVS